MNLAVDIICSYARGLPQGASGEFVGRVDVRFEGNYFRRFPFPHDLNGLRRGEWSGQVCNSVNRRLGGDCSSATVDRNAEIDIDVPLDQVDDILKSIVIRDGGGHVKSLSLAGPTPVDETFKTLPFKPSDLTSLPSHHRCPTPFILTDRRNSIRSVA